MGETPRLVDLREFLAQIVDEFPLSQRPQIQVDVAEDGLAAILPVQATAQSIAALIHNALDANCDGRPIVITAERTASELRIMIKDRGQGMQANVLRRIAEPFFTTKEPGKGMGLGTFLVRTFAESLGGRVRFDSIPGEGTTATLELPLRSPRQNAHAAV